MTQIGICNPHFLIINGYFSEEVGFNVKEKMSHKEAAPKAKNAANESQNSGSSGDTTPPDVGPPPNKVSSTPLNALVDRLKGDEMSEPEETSPISKTRFRVINISI